MHYTYVLLCFNKKENFRKFYIGTTADLKARVIKHKTKSVETTKSFDKIELVYYEACLGKTDAMKREKQLKTGFGRGSLKRRVSSYLKNLQD